MDPYTAMWDEQLVKSIFWAPNTTIILALPIKEDMKDGWDWHLDHRGYFSIKSAYKLCKQMELVR